MTIVREIERAFLDGARVVNFSSDISHQWTSTPSSRLDSQKVGYIDSLLSSAIARLRRQGRDPLLVVPAGDFLAGSARSAFWAGYAATKARYPSNILVVASASSSNSSLTSTSGRGPLVTVAATGQGVWGLDTQNPTGSPRNGVSYALPQVSGVAGLPLSFMPTLTSGDLVQLIDSGAIRGGSSADGVPLLNAYEALRLAASRPGAPLCGNRVWSGNDFLWAERSHSGGRASISTASAAATRIFRT